jgi:hypothetical protein
MRNKSLTHSLALLVTAAFLFAAVSCKKSVIVGSTDVAASAGPALGNTSASLIGSGFKTVRVSISQSQFNRLYEMGNHRVVSTGTGSYAAADIGPGEPGDCDEQIRQVVNNWRNTDIYKQLRQWANQCCCDQYYCWCIPDCACILFVVRPGLGCGEVAYAYELQAYQ